MRFVIKSRTVFYMSCLVSDKFFYHLKLTTNTCSLLFVFVANVVDCLEDCAVGVGESYAAT